ncbi:hypothetical protein FYJ28_09080 [Arthrobacter sp. BL-252-APC-1A]|uniref:hypothetical protein n=1 Tax=Arthrobacter sp. BL-252-APC-1A TaxID=2606622 RepID=UPI0012B272ED|nr:hypothetical protein [Arthrobacter sp. BL-252-APC-1A]MSR98976.1 hypothetical protein [Arthrobacter sp. BL-252-APC-1A]
MNSTSSNPSDRESVRRLLAESGVPETPELGEALMGLRAEGHTAVPAASPQLEAFFSAGVTPLRRPSRRRGYLLGGAIIAAMAAGTTGVAATSGGLWVTAEDSPEVPAPFDYEQVPAPSPSPEAQNPAAPDPAAVPSAVPVEPDAPPADETPDPAGDQPVQGEMQTGLEQDPGTPGKWQHEGPGQSGNPGQGWNNGQDSENNQGRNNGPGWKDDHHSEKTYGWQKTQDWPGQAAENKDRGQGGNRDRKDDSGRQNTGKDGNRGGSEQPGGRGDG